MGDHIDLLVNDLYKFKVMHNGHLLKKSSNILSTIFFKMNQYYKNLKTYVNGLDKLVSFGNYWNNKHPDDKFNLLIFIDRYIYEDKQIMNILKKGKETIIILFDCVDYIKEDYHMDLFTTMVRFFPMFNFDNNPFNCVICVDIDLHDEDYLRLMTAMANKPTGLSAVGNILPLLYDRNGKGYIFACMCCMMELNKYDRNLLINFIKNAEKYKSLDHYNKRLTLCGIDEIFLNEILIPVIDRYNIMIEYQINYFLVHSKKYMEKKKRIKNTTAIVDQILGRYNKSNAPLDIKLKLIDKDTYNVRVANKLNSYYTKRFSNVIRYLYENKKKWMERKVIKFIYRYLLDVVYAVVLINTDMNGTIHDCILYNQILVLENEDYI